jgi:hypothetical protein
LQGLPVSVTLDKHIDNLDPLRARESSRHPGELFEYGVFELSSFHTIAILLFNYLIE